MINFPTNTHTHTHTAIHIFNSDLEPRRIYSNWAYVKRDRLTDTEKEMGWNGSTISKCNRIKSLNGHHLEACESTNFPHNIDHKIWNTSRRRRHRNVTSRYRTNSNRLVSMIFFIVVVVSFSDLDSALAVALSNGSADVGERVMFAGYEMDE